MTHITKISFTLLFLAFPIFAFGQSSTTCADQLEKIRVERLAAHERLKGRSSSLGNGEVRARKKALNTLYREFTRTRGSGIKSSERSKNECGPLEAQFMEKLELVEGGQISKKRDLQPDLVAIRRQQTNRAPESEPDVPEDLPPEEDSAASDSRESESARRQR